MNRTAIPHAMSPISTLMRTDESRPRLVRGRVFHIVGNRHVNRVVVERESQRSSVNRAQSVNVRNRFCTGDAARGRPVRLPGNVSSE